MEQARTIATDMLQDPEHALDTLAREELGLNPDDLGSPWGAALSSFLAFSVGALIPLMPFLSGLGGIGSAAIVTAIALFIVGAMLSLFTGRSALHSGLRMVLIGGAAGLITYVTGSLLGVSVL
jgi:VIT1/CCC1 family predicted Fe2+/Mn2+ transporter